MAFIVELVSDANILVSQVLQAVDMINTDNGRLVGQCDVTVNDTAGEVLIALTADLLHRSFKWQQSPLLDGDVWAEGVRKPPPEE
jgi:hypothetical protein